MKISFLTLSILLINLLFGQPISDEIFQNAQRSVCFIKIIQEIDENIELISSGCGVTLRDNIDNEIFYCFATAYHVVESLIKMRDTYAQVYLYDPNGYIYSTKNIDIRNIIWKDKTADAALLLIPLEVQIIGERPKGYTNPGIDYLKNISHPKWGDDVFLIGYRLIDSKNFIYILKKGIVSCRTATLPGYLGHKVIIIDNMANKGMSGGLVFNSTGEGLAVISSYLLENAQKVQTSDDLTICLPLQIFYDQMKSHKDVIKKLLPLINK